MAVNRLIYGILLVLSVLFANFYGGKIPYMLLFITLLLPLFSFLYTLVLFASFKYIQSVDGKYVLKGDKLKYRLNINNEGPLYYPYVKINFHISSTFLAGQLQEESFSLLPGEKTSFSYELECKYRGVFAIGLSSVEFEDLLGMFRLRFNIKETKEIIIYPKIVYLDIFHLRTSFLSDTHTLINSLYEDFTTISDIRRYSYGDTMKRIHWKLSAKMDELYVKTFQGTSRTVATIFLDLKRIEGPMENQVIVEDKLIESAVAVIRYCLYNWIPVDLVYCTKDIVNLEAKAPSDFERIYKELAQIRFDQSVAITDVMELFWAGSIKKTDVFIFTADLNYDLYNQIYKIRHNGYDVNIIYISSDTLKSGINPDIASITEFLTDIGVSVYRLEVNDDIKLALESKL
ncbi:DUF58 domain-containing protein [Pseudoclostridium thermosuccinogenes]|uniref:DUF58 domain-containing protein n=1 Tax=Clostridium thermosuccinogenes TaxID=84032 RepID=UPI002FDAB8D9